MAQMSLTPKSVRIAADEAKWLSAAATNGEVTQNDLIRLALHRLRKDLGAASRIKPETVLATAKASKYKLTPPRTAGAAVPAAGWDVLTIVAAISVCSSGGSLPKRCDSGRRRTPVGAIG